MIIDEAGNADDIETARSLFRAYAAGLPFSLDFQNFAEELAELPAPYTAPAGCLLVARGEGGAVGVVALKPLAAGIAELKRLYVVRGARGTGVGRMLAERALEAAAAKGYQRVRLDTHRPSMSAAIVLYRRLGFIEIPPYGPDLGGEISFFEKHL